MTGAGSIGIGPWTFADPVHGWTASAGKILATADGGVTFTSLGKTEGPLQQWVTADFGWSLTGGGQLTVTRDGGKTTSAVTAPCRIYPASALPDGTIWGVSQSCPDGPKYAVLVSHNYGGHWTVYDLGDVRVSRIAGVSDREAWLTDELGLTYITDDGGKSWTLGSE